jgi:hypothetical protein
MASTDKSDNLTWEIIYDNKGSDMGFDGLLVNQSEKRILKTHIIILFICPCENLGQI